MAKKKSWFSLVKRFFLFETIAKTDKKEKRRKWIFGRLRTKRLTAPPCDNINKDDRALTVVIPTAESAVTAYAAEVVPVCDEQTVDVQLDSSSSNEQTVDVQLDSSSSNEQTVDVQLDSSSSNEQTVDVQLDSSSSNEQTVDVQLDSSSSNEQTVDVQLDSSSSNEQTVDVQLDSSSSNEQTVDVQLDSSSSNEQTVDVQLDSSSSNEHTRKIEEHSATKIQASFRGYLARKALRALKGIVKLQAIIRGRAVRRQAMNTLKCLQSIVNIQSQVCAKRFQKAEGTWQYDETEQLVTLEDKIIKVDINSQRRWDDSILTKEEAEAMVLSKKEAAIKRERIKGYSYLHRKSAESEQNKGNGSLKFRLDEWVEKQVTKSKELEDLDSIWTLNRNPAVENRAKQLRVKTFPRQYQYNLEGLGSPVVPIPRRSYHKKQYSVGEEDCFSTSPVVPTYMAATQSAKAKVRSMSSPKVRPGSFDTQSESYSPYKNKLCIVSSITRNIGYQQQRSPSLKGVAGLVKSKRTLKDLSFNSECSLHNWVQKTSFR